MRTLGVCFMAGMCLILASCGANSKDLLLGTWKGKNQG